MGGVILKQSSLEQLCIQHLSSAGVAFRRDPSGTIRIPAASGEVGDLIIDFDGGEITVDIENITHCHFTPYEASATYAANTIEDCAQGATEFVLSVLNDRRILWRYPNGAGGSYEIGADHEHAADTPLEGDDVKKFVWSGPYRDTN